MSADRLLEFEFQLELAWAKCAGLARRYQILRDGVRTSASNALMVRLAAAEQEAMAEVQPIDALVKRLRAEQSGQQS